MDKTDAVLKNNKDPKSTSSNTESLLLLLRKECQDKVDGDLFGYSTCPQKFDDLKKKFYERAQQNRLVLKKIEKLIETYKHASRELARIEKLPDADKSDYDTQFSVHQHKNTIYEIEMQVLTFQTTIMMSLIMKNIE